MDNPPEDLPKAVVVRLLKENIPAGTMLQKDAIKALQRAATTFILYTSACAYDHAVDRKRVTIQPGDVIYALNENDFSELVPGVDQFMKDFSQVRKREREKKTQENPPSKATKANADDSPSATATTNSTMNKELEPSVGSISDDADEHVDYEHEAEVDEIEVDDVEIEAEDGGGVGEEEEEDADDDDEEEPPSSLHHDHVAID